MGAFIRLTDGLSRLCGIASMLLLAAAVIIVCQMVFARYVLGQSTVWQTEFVIYSLMASTFLGAPYVLLHKAHVGVDLVPNMLYGAPAIALKTLAGLISLAFCAVLAWSSWHYFHEAWAGGWTTDTVWALPLWIPLLPLPLGIGILCLQYVAEILKQFQPEAGS